MSDQVLLALISSLGTVIVGYIGRWLYFRVTLNGKFAIGADEEFKAFRHELQVKIQSLETKVETLMSEKNELLVERARRDGRIEDLQEALDSAKIRIKELEEKIYELENRSGKTQEG